MIELSAKVTQPKAETNFQSQRVPHIKHPFLHSSAVTYDVPSYESQEMRRNLQLLINRKQPPCFKHLTMQQAAAKDTKAENALCLQWNEVFQLFSR